MKQVRFGSTELTVSQLGFGCARLGGIFQSSSGADIQRTLHLAYDQGITFYDTADMYSQGESEALLGKAFRGRREKVIIASKAGYCLPARRRVASRIKPLLKPVIRGLGLKRSMLPAGIRGSLEQDFSDLYLHKAVDQSLKRLGTDYLDLYQLHSPPAAVLEDGTFLDPLEQLKQAGKIRYYGVSCETAEDALICLRYPGISSLQVRLSLLDQRALDCVLPQAHIQGIAIIARECFAGGLLARPADAEQLAQFIPDPVARAAKQLELQAYQRIAESDGRLLTEIALQFAVGQDSVSVTLLGMRTDEQLRTNLGLLTAVPLSEQLMETLRQSRVPGR